MLMPYIIQVLLFITHVLIIYSLIYFLINTFFFPLWMVDANFIFILVFISSYFRSVWHPFGCFILRMVYLILSYFIYVVLFSLYTFSSCSSHIVNFFFFKVLAHRIWLISHNAVNTRSQSRTLRQCTCTRPVRQMPFRAQTIEDEKIAITLINSSLFAIVGNQDSTRVKTIKISQGQVKCQMNQLKRLA